MMKVAIECAVQLACAGNDDPPNADHGSKLQSPGARASRRPSCGSGKARRAKRKASGEARKIVEL